MSAGPQAVHNPSTGHLCPNRHSANMIEAPTPGAPTMTTQSTTETTLTRLAAERARLLEQRAIIDEELEANKAAILAATDGPDTYAAGPLSVVVTTAARIDPAKIKVAYPPNACPELYTQTVNTKAIRDHIAAVDLEEFLTYSAPSVTLR